MFMLYNIYIMILADAAFFALADSTRRAILVRLAQGDATVAELKEPFAISQPAVSRHLKVLEAAGLISRRAQGASRPCHLEAKGFESIDRWLSTMRETMELNFTRLDNVLQQMPSTAPTSC